MFKEVFDFVMKLEGGYVLHKNATEEAETYAGIYREAHPHWLGWTFLDNGETPPESLVLDTYKFLYWDKIPLEDGLLKGIIFEYGVNAGLGKAIKTAQVVVGVVADGDIGPKTKAALEGMPFDVFLVKYNMERIKHYANLVNNNQGKYGIYLRGWLNRVLDSQKWFESKSL